MAENNKNAPVALLRKLDEMAARHDALREQLNDTAVLGNPHKVIAVSKEAGKLDPVVTRYRDYQQAVKAVGELRELSSGKGDPEMAELAAAELPEAEAKADGMLESLKDEFVAAEDKAVDSFFLEIRAGTGGEEAALFALDLFEMYRKYAETRRWGFIVSDFSPSDRGGCKEVIVNV